MRRLSLQGIAKRLWYVIVASHGERVEERISCKTFFNVDCVYSQIKTFESPPRTPRQLAEPHRPHFARCLGRLIHAINYVMAAHPAAKAINTQEITDKARRDLLQLLEAVCERHLLKLTQRQANKSRFEARRIWSSNARWPALSAFLSSSAHSRNMASTRSSSSRTTTWILANGMSYFWSEAIMQRLCGR